MMPPPELWDSFVESHPRAHPLQLSAWGEHQEAFGWQAERVALEAGGLVAGAQILYSRLPARLGTRAYIPFGPLVNWEDAAQTEALFTAIHRAARPRAAFLKVEAGFSVPIDRLQALGLRPSPQNIQAPNTLLLTLDSEEALLARMNQGTRRNIRKSAKFEVVIRQARTPADLDSFCALIEETGGRQGFHTHSAAYYRRAYDLFVPRGQAALFLASYAGQDLAGVFVFKAGRLAVYLYGASREAERERMAPFGAQWAAIRWAQAQACTHYDLFGIPDAPPATLEAEFETRHDGLWGVYRFKRGWGGQVVRSVGAWDYVYQPLVYAAYQLGTRLRRP